MSNYADFLIFVIAVNEEAFSKIKDAGEEVGLGLELGLVLQVFLKLFDALFSACHFLSIGQKPFWILL